MQNINKSSISGSVLGMGLDRAHSGYDDLAVIRRPMIEHLSWEHFGPDRRSVQGDDFRRFFHRIPEDEKVVCDCDSRRNSSRVDRGLGGPIRHDADD